MKYPNDEELRKFYNSARWKKLREYIRQRDNNECQWCKAEGKFSPAECVHHKKEVRDYWELRFEPNNLITLCNNCHETKAHPEKKHNLFKFPKKKKVPKEWW